MNDSRESESCRMVRVWPTAPKMTSWWATSPGSRTLWIGDHAVAAAPRARPASTNSPVRAAVPDGSIQLALVVQFDHLAGREVPRRPRGRTAS